MKDKRYYGHNSKNIKCPSFHFMPLIDIGISFPFLAYFGLFTSPLLKRKTIKKTDVIICNNLFMYDPNIKVVI